MGFLPCPLAVRHSNIQDYSDTSTSNSQSHSSTSTTHLHSSSSSLSSQPSLPSVPSLTTSDKSQPPPPHHRLVTTLQGHSSAVFSLFLAGKHLYSGSSDTQIRSWPRDVVPDNNKTAVVIPSSHSAVKSIVVSGHKLFTAHQDHKIRVWKIIDDNYNSTPKNSNNNNNTDNTTYRCITTLPTLADRVARCFMARNYVEVRRHKKCTWVHHVDAVSSLALSRDGSLLYSGSWDRSFKVWRTSDFKCLESVWSAHDDAINALVLSGADDGCVYTGSADTKIKVWKKEEGEKKKHRLVDVLEKHNSAVNALALSGDGSVLYSGACDRSIIVWEKGKDSGCGGGGGGRRMVVAGALRGHKKAILCLAVVGELVCSGSADKTVRIWRSGSGSRDYSCLAVLEGHRGPVKCLAAAVDHTCSGDSNNFASPGTSSYKVYSGSLDFDIKVWELRVPLLIQ